MRLFFFIGLLAISPLMAKPTRSLAEASSRIMRHFPSGVVVCAEVSATRPEPVFAFAGQTPTSELSPEHWRFEIGHLTELFNGLLLAIAVEESRVSLDSTLNQLLEPQRRFTSHELGEITLRELATHRSGLPDLPSEALPHLLHAEPDLLAPDAPLWKLLNQTKLAPSKAYRHSTLGHAILGSTLANVYGDRWESLIQKKICRPLGLANTGEMRVGQAELVGHAGTSFPAPMNTRALLPALGLRSTAHDLTLLAQALLHPEQTPIEDAIKRCLQVHANTFPKMGLGLTHDDFFDEPSFEQRGETAGFQAAVQILPKSQTIRVLLTNQSQLSPERILQALMQRPTPPLASQRRYSDEALDDFVGRYQISEGEFFDLVKDRQQLWMKPRGGSFAPLFVHEQERRFFLKNEPVQIQFERAPQRVTLFTFYHLGRTRVAHKLDKGPHPSLSLASSSAFSGLLGTYRTHKGELVKIVSKRHHLELQSSDATVLALYRSAKHPQTFQDDFGGVKIVFLPRESDAPQRLEWHQSGQIHHATYTGP